jgi:acyl carrier protein
MPLEKTLTEIWSRVLSLNRVGVHDNFFTLGGNSLLVVRVAALAEQILKIEIPVARLFQYTTISSLAKYLDQDQSFQPSYENLQDRSQRRKAVLSRKKRSTRR